MSRNMYMRFPGGKAKALTLSYDDGVEQDIRLIDILDKHGIKATFNINSGSYAPEDKQYKPGQVHRRMSKSRCTELYNKNGHEVAVHAYTHPFLEKLPAPAVAYEIVKDKAKVLEDNYYLIGERYIRLFDRPQFDQFFGQFKTVSLEEIHTVRFKNQRDHWEFIFQKD